ncbi:hypothetical protein BS78_02G110500 [Paspalum vaginatum]|nr:hypothetical protein BS78_02G110500 [Paspalum vaginatum]
MGGGEAALGGSGSPRRGVAVVRRGKGGEGGALYRRRAPGWGLGEPRTEVAWSQGEAERGWVGAGRGARPGRGRCVDGRGTAPGWGPEVGDGSDMRGLPVRERGGWAGGTTRGAQVRGGGGAGWAGRPKRPELGAGGGGGNGPAGGG